MDAADWVFSKVAISNVMFTYVFLIGRRPNSVIEIARFDSKLQLARNTCERKQAKRRKHLPRERLVQGKKHARNKAPIASCFFFLCVFVFLLCVLRTSWANYSAAFP